VNYLSESGNCSAPTCLTAEPSSLRASKARKRHMRKAARAAASPRPTQFPPALRVIHEWEAVQAMLLASRPKFIGLAYSILRNKEDAEEAVQNAMLSAYLHLRNFEGRSAFTTWFTRIVFNAALMIRRKRKLVRIESFPDSSENDEIRWAERIPAAQSDPEMACAEAETFRTIDELLGKMRPVLRQAFTMVYYDELSAEEAGALLGVTAGTFKSRVFRARQHLIRRAKRSLLVPIRCATHTPFSSGSSLFTASAESPADISSPEVARG
jgi:RNA polymerase sigma-70 factor, ECF subfamily